MEAVYNNGDWILTPDGYGIVDSLYVNLYALGDYLPQDKKIGMVNDEWVRVRLFFNHKFSTKIKLEYYLTRFVRKCTKKDTVRCGDLMLSKQLEHKHKTIKSQDWGLAETLKYDMQDTILNSVLEGLDRLVSIGGNFTLDDLATHCPMLENYRLSGSITPVPINGDKRLYITMVNVDFAQDARSRRIFSNLTYRVV